MVSSVILFTITSFILGYIFGQLWQKRKLSTETSDDAHLQSSHIEQAPDPSAISHTIIPAEQDQLEMMENAAYGPLKWTTNKLFDAQLKCS
jgi:hypothetical protein